MSDPGKRAGPIRVLAANVPMVVTEMLSQAMVGQPDLELVGQVTGNVEALIAVRAGVDVVILGVHNGQAPPALCGHLFGEDPDLRILALDAAGDMAVLYWLGLRQQALPIVSVDGVLETIRKAYQINPMS